MNSSVRQLEEIKKYDVAAEQKTADGIATLWVSPEKVHDVLEFSEKSNRQAVQNAL